jgi:hypothetical protein
MGYFERLEELLSFTTDHQLRLVCEWGLAHGPTRRATAHMANTDAARKRKRRGGRGGGGGGDSDSDREENTPGREKKPKNLSTSAVSAATTGGETASGQHNTARRGSKSSRSRRRREEEEAAAAAAAAALQDDNSDERVDDRSDDEDAYALDHFDMDLENRLPLGKQVKLNFVDRTNFVKLASDCYEVRNDSASFGSIRANCYVSSVDRYPPTLLPPLRPLLQMLITHCVEQEWESVYREVVLRSHPPHGRHHADRVGHQGLHLQARGADTSPISADSTHAPGLLLLLLMQARVGRNAYDLTCAGGLGHW